MPPDYIDPTVGSWVDADIPPRYLDEVDTSAQGGTPPTVAVQLVKDADQ